MKPNKATMANVASKAGVSAATVARVIYKNGYVKEETRRLVEAAVKVTGYSPSLVARSLRTSRSFTLGLVLNESQLNTFPMAVAQAVQLEALKHGYTVLGLNNQRDADLEDQGVRRLLDHHVDAIIFCTAVDPSSVRMVENQGTPTVQVERIAAQVGSVVSVDPSQGMQQAVDHLVSLGHRSFAFFGGEKPSKFSEGAPEELVETLRERFFLENLARHGIQIQPERLKRTPYYIDGKPKHQPAYFLIDEILRLDPRPTALICGSDLLAAAALQGLHDAGVRVPDDMSVVGFDDTLADILTPSLSSIAQPVAELGKLAVRLAMDAIDNPGQDGKRNVVPTTFVQRNSTGSAPVANSTSKREQR